jgi:hypothetical protein
MPCRASYPPVYEWGDSGAIYLSSLMLHLNLA